MTMDYFMHDVHALWLDAVDRGGDGGGGIATVQRIKKNLFQRNDAYVEK